MGGNNSRDNQFNLEDEQSLVGVKIGQSIQHILEPSEIVPHFLYLSSFYFLKEHPDKLETFNIRYIINCSLETPNIIHNKKVKYFRCELKDVPEQNISHILEPAFKIMRKAKEKKVSVLVHCAQGRSRSVSVVIAYLIKYLDYTYLNAIEHVHKCRSIAFPNPGFASQLINFEERVIGVNTFSMKDYYIMELCVFHGANRKLAEKAIDYFGVKQISHVELFIIKNDENITKEEALLKLNTSFKQYNFLS
jgi:protein-tyrosine phosphatase